MKTLKEKLYESVERGDVRKLIDDIRCCAKAGKFEKKKNLFNFIADAAKHMRHDGHIVYHESTHRMFEMLKHYGGPRSNRLFIANAFGPHLRTTEKRWARDMHHFRMGILEENFIFLAKFYTAVLTSLGITLGNVPCEHSEDESACQDEPRWNERHDDCVGF